MVLSAFLGLPYIRRIKTDFVTGISKEILIFFRTFMCIRSYYCLFLSLFFISFSFVLFLQHSDIQRNSSMSYIGSAYHHYSTLPPHSEQNFSPCVTSAPQNLHFLLSEAGSFLCFFYSSLGRFFTDQFNILVHKQSENPNQKEYITKQLSNQLSPPGVIYSMYYDMTF